MSVRSLAAIAALTLCKLSAQSYSPMYPPESVTSQGWVCRDETTGQAVPYASWWINESGYWTGTNHHLHYNSYPPISSESPSSGTADGSGNFSFYLTSSLISQAEYYVVGCSAPGYQAEVVGPFNGPTTQADYTEDDYAIGYSDIYWVDHPEIFYKIGGNTTNHGDNTGNHWMMSSPAYGIYNTSVAYVNQYNPGQLVCDNDMALPFGGKFDINDNWMSPHAAHDRGSSVDIAVTSNQCPGSYVVTNPSAFLSLCLTNGAVGNGVSYYNSTDIHCNWLNPYTYPH